MSDVENKVKFILAWYNKEKGRFSFPKQVMLAKTWIDICTKSEEYEMASALQKEQEKIVKEYLAWKRADRTWKEKLWYYTIKLIRKFK